jgi:hypothetical protein
VDLNLIPRPVLRESIPDAQAIANNPDLHGVELNRAINRTYVSLSRHLQKVLDPGFSGSSEVAPSWYAMAIYASRGAGKGMLAAQRALQLAQNQQSLRAAFPSVPAEDWQKIQPLLDAKGPMADAATFLVAFGLGQQEGPNRITLDPRVLAISAGRLADIISRPETGLATFVHTLHTMLEDGNRRIFADIGVAGQRYLELRRDQGPLTPQQVLEAFSDQPEQATPAYQDGLRWARESEDLPTHFDQLYAQDTRALLAAGLALYERASSETDRRVRDRLIRHAGNLMAYHEQACVAVPAFLPPQVLPGETERAAVMEVLTPQIDVQTRDWTWSLHQMDLPDLDESFWTPPSTERNWAYFNHRWEPILDYFGRCADQPASLWPMPCPDPALPMDGQSRPG